MKIVQVGAFPMDTKIIRGGVEASVYGLAMEQQKTNDVLVLDVPRRSLQNDSIERIENLSIYRFQSKGRNNLSLIKRIPSLLSIIKKFQPDICHLHSSSQFSLLLYIVLRLKSTPTIVTVHGLAHIEKSKELKKKHSLKNFLKYLNQSLSEFLILSLSKTVIVDTQYVADEILKYKKQWKIWRKPVCKVIPQGINNVFYNIEENIKENSILSVGVLSKRKGYLYLIEAMHLVIQKIPNAKLRIVGALSDPDYYEKMKEKVSILNLENHILITPNAKFEDVLKHYSKSDVFALHSEEESQGIVFCEALAAGKPIVATNTGGIPWVVENNRNGFLSDFADIESFANNIVSMLVDDNLKNQIRTTNKKDALKYNWESIAKEIRSIYKTLVD